MRALDAGLDAAATVALGELARSRAAVRSACSVRGAGGRVPDRGGRFPAFMREVGDVHRELYPENAELYGENIRGKIERCIALDDAEYEAARRARAEHAERARGGARGLRPAASPRRSRARRRRRTSSRWRSGPR